MVMTIVRFLNVEDTFLQTKDGFDHTRFMVLVFFQVQTSHIAIDDDLDPCKPNETARVRIKRFKEYACFGCFRYGG